MCVHVRELVCVSVCICIYIFVSKFVYIEQGTSFFNKAERKGIHCNTLHHTATHCNTLHFFITK